MTMLQEKIPLTYSYHNCEHTLYVIDKVIEIGKKENCTEDELTLLKAAALWHDTGFIKVYEDHEEAGCDLAKFYLPEYGFYSPEVDIICGMIMATRIPQQPKNKLEEIVVDADLEYLGSDLVKENAEKLFKELNALDPQLARDEWNKRQITFLQHHEYFTQYCKEVKEPVKQAYLKELIKDSILSL